MHDLMTLIPQDSGWEELFEAAAINDLGVIVGSGVLKGEINAFVATPIPEPAAISLALFAFALIAAWRARSAYAASPRTPEAGERKCR